MKTICALVLTSVFFLQPLFGEGYQPAHTVMIPMRDGVTLPTDIYLPHKNAKGLPCILVRTPAGRKMYKDRFAALIREGYTVAIQDTRSYIDREGKTFPYLTDGWDELQDGYDTVEWLSCSKYTNGKIGTMGFSAMGITQVLMAPAAPPSLQCQYIGVAASSLYHHALFIGGQVLKNQAEGWLAFYAKDPAILRYVTQQVFYNDFWRRLDTIPVADRVKVPAIHYGGWYDIFLQGTIDAFLSRQERGGEGAKGTQKLVIGPWNHAWPQDQTLGDFAVPEQGRKIPIDISPKRWFDFYLKGIDNGIDKIPTVIYYVMGPFDGSPSSGNVWRFSDQWPVSAEPVSYYLATGGVLQSHTPESFVHEISYLYDPENPVPTVGGWNLFMPSGPKDQRSVEAREDVLVFTTEPLQEDVEVTGRILAKLFFSSNREDTDVTVKLTDVYPDGRSILIADGICRLCVVKQEKRDQEKRDQEKRDQKKRDQEKRDIDFSEYPQEVEVDLWSTSLVFAKGHRIRLAISSSNYPRFEKNSNTGHTGHYIGPPLIAQNAIHVGDQYPSRLVLPIVRH